MFIVVNADDLGTSEPINNETFALMESGLVTSSTIIANSPAFEPAMARTRDFPKCSFGVHLNLTVFPPLTGSRGLEAVLDEKGHLSPKLSQANISGALRDALFGELSAQVQRVLDAGVPVSHFDSHQHIHTIPALFPVLKQLQRKFGIRRVRPTINLLPASQRMTPMRWLKKAVYSTALQNWYATKSPEGLGDFRDFYAVLKSGSTPRFRTMELMVHPGTGSPRYSDEIDLLRSGWRQLLPAGVSFGSYHAI